MKADKKPANDPANEPANEPANGSDPAEIRISILRQAYPGAEPYRQTFAYDGSPQSTVAAALDNLNYRDEIVDIDGDPVPRIGWEGSCLQGMYGGCAMVINGRPALACSTFIKDLGTEIKIEPLSKFPTVSDLVVDRTVIQANLLAADAYTETGGTAKSGRTAKSGNDVTAEAIADVNPEPKSRADSKIAKADEKEYDHRYAAAKCLKCGLCLEVCPNYVKGENFFGAAFANDCYLIASGEKSFSKGKAGAAIKDAYDKHFAAGCSKSLSCMDVCPMDIPTLSSMAKMNR